MGQYFLDFVLIAGLIVGITALSGVMSSGIGTRILGKGNENLHVNHTLMTQKGWKTVGGKK